MHNQWTHLAEQGLDQLGIVRLAWSFMGGQRDVKVRAAKPCIGHNGPDIIFS